MLNSYIVFEHLANDETNCLVFPSPVG